MAAVREMLILLLLHAPLVFGFVSLKDLPRKQVPCPNNRQDVWDCRQYEPPQDLDYYCTTPWLIKHCPYTCKECDVIPDCNTTKKDKKNCYRFADPRTLEYYCTNTWFVRKNCVNMCKLVPGYCPQ